ncbi:hypothetical protein [Hyphomicrobium sp. MC8b]|uniref:hypothetical protein n=1 Tax=Hyphomicrobium sp. MC8b TaxID=300273 RepID=UPI0039191139
MQPPVFDDRDQEIKNFLLAYWNSILGPRVGDFVQTEDGTLHRFTQDWDDRLQITSSLDPAGGSFYFALGYCSYSGGLDPSIPKSRLYDTGAVKDGNVWFFHHDIARAHNGVTTAIPCRVYRVLPAQTATAN